MSEFYSNPGSNIRPEYILNDDGRIEVVGSSDIQEEINSYADSVSLKRIIDSAMDFDDPRLHVNPGIYMDTTVLPRTASEVSDLGKYNKRKISGLPPELRNLSLEDFMKLSNDEIVNILNDSKNKKIDKNIEKKENNENE